MFCYTHFSLPSDNRKSRLAVGVFNPGYDKIPRKKSDEEDEAVLAVDTLLDHVMNINIDGFSDEFQVSTR